MGGSEQGLRVPVRPAPREAGRGWAAEGQASPRLCRGLPWAHGSAPQPPRQTPSLRPWVLNGAGSPGIRCGLRGAQARGRGTFLRVATGFSLWLLAWPGRP